MASKKFFTDLVSAKANAGSALRHYQAGLKAQDEMAAADHPQYCEDDHETAAALVSRAFARRDALTELVETARTGTSDRAMKILARQVCAAVKQPHFNVSDLRVTGLSEW